jgi:DNA-binding NarL/FixJ family response regulator
MIVESQPLMRTALSTALAAEGMTVLAEVAHNQDLLSGFNGESPDLILFSLGNAAADDLQTIASLRQRLPQTAIAALVTGELNGQAEAALAHGAHLVLEKSVSRTALLEALYELSR